MKNSKAKKTKHTKGPWSVCKGVKGGNSEVWIGADTGSGHLGYFSEVAYCLTHLDGHKANARLIAAAPEMLEAMEEMLKALEEHGKMISTSQVRAFKLMEAAIKKAKGE